MAAGRLVQNQSRSNRVVLGQDGKTTGFTKAKDVAMEAVSVKWWHKPGWRGLRENGVGGGDMKAVSKEYQKVGGG